MAQGSGIKKKTVIASKSKGNNISKRRGLNGSTSVPLRKGRISKAPKKQDAAKHLKLQKKLRAGVTNTLEQAMSVKAGAVGKLTIMKDAQNAGKNMEIKKRKY
ncbi:hypothetical protein COEREDRAFT_89527 [Coemansia reversa NRRL 1564]|uniref:Uncharacterized protein n=1 Tax=Coemansia reversa (strain ATCC 12441 / NRRL 1564) TaxID=763665 RepID=A0A2G5B3B5_COERN|nr:hypothetical protein COEREDRAFT_89527 [Coemansia reversa NRRL 1564]|eukprot:PIA13513.1 hypothetical protein COEREDRAFT_89527 [Coemansia reversa NRRL 1564]